MAPQSAFAAAAAGGLHWPSAATSLAGLTQAAAATPAAGAAGEVAVGLSAAPAAGGSAHIPVLQQALKDVEEFDKAFTGFQKSGPGKIPEAIALAWEKVYSHKDRLSKMKDYLWECKLQEQALVGPRPEDTDTADARELMENSVSANINAVAKESQELVSTCERAQTTISGSRGISDQVNELIAKLASAKQKIAEMTTGELPVKEDLQPQVAASFVPISPGVAALLLAGARTHRCGPWTRRRPSRAGMAVPAPAATRRFL